MQRPLLALIVAAAAAIVTFFFTGCASAPPQSKSRGTFGGSPAKPSSYAPPEQMRERPGLGTGWGEERDSRTSPTHFVRSESGRPAAQGQLFYNDREGVEAMSAYEGGGARRSRGLQEIPGGLVSIGLRDSSGRWLDGYEVGGRRFIAGTKGERYEIVARNETGARLETVLSVDGLDVMDGRSASPTKRGYIIDGGDTLTIDGFRTSSATVAAFRFSRVSRSYAALRHGDTRNVGVVGVAVFTERYAEPWRGGDREATRRRAANPFPGKRWAVPPE